MEKLKNVSNAIKSSMPPVIPIAKPAVFGAAPSLRELKNMSKEKRKQYRGAIFWYYFRVCYPYVMPILVLIFMIIALTAWNTVEGHLVMGSILSLLSSVLVISSYLMIMPWRKHPSTLIIYRTLSSIVFSVNIILNAVTIRNGQALSCRNFSVVTQMMLLAGEGWLTTLANDLVCSLTNPFTSYKQNLQRYQIAVWGISAFIASTLFYNPKCQGEVDNGICWLSITSQTMSCLWGYYLFWIVCMYCYQIWAAVFAYFRLKKGLPATFEIRKQCAIETFRCLFCYAIYMSLLMLFFFIVASQPLAPPGSSMNNFALFLLFVVANKGTVDGAVWFSLHDFTRESDGSASGAGGDAGSKYAAVQDEKDVEEGQDTQDAAGGRQRSSSLLIGKSLSKNTRKIQEEIAQIEGKMKKTITRLADLAIEELDEADLSPQVNLALRQQIVQYVTTGVKTAIARQSRASGGYAAGLPQDQTTRKRSNTWEVDEVIGAIGSRSTYIPSRDKAHVEGISVDSFLLEGEFPFKSYAPAVFQSLRESEGITEDYYLKVLSQPANERLSEGASGAFMFFCGGGEFIVKTIRDREARVLHNSLKDYVNHLKLYKSSFLCRFLGSYSLEVYSQTFYFVVMANCFDPKAKINERYDIKGSWVGRSADPGKNKKKSVCRHCNTYFVPSKKELCSVVVGTHEANIVLKDNDLRTKIHLMPSESSMVMEMIKKDSELLGKLGVMDYSLLIGVKKRKFPVIVELDDGAGGDGGSHALVTAGGNRQSTFRASSVTGPALYYLGIVDFLQDWTFSKRIERMFKIYILRKDPDGLSVMEPIGYMERFQGKMEQMFAEETEDSKLRPALPSNSNIASSLNRKESPAPSTASASTASQSAARSSPSPLTSTRQFPPSSAASAEVAGIVRSSSGSDLTRTPKGSVVKRVFGDVGRHESPTHRDVVMNPMLEVSLDAADTPTSAIQAHTQAHAPAAATPQQQQQHPQKPQKPQQRPSLTQSQSPLVQQTTAAGSAAAIRRPSGGNNHNQRGLAGSRSKDEQMTSDDEYVIANASSPATSSSPVVNVSATIDEEEYDDML